MLSEEYLQILKTQLTIGVLYYNVQYEAPEKDAVRKLENMVLTSEYFGTPISFLLAVGGVTLGWGLERSLSKEETKWLVNTLFSYAKTGDVSCLEGFPLSETGKICRGAFVETINELANKPQQVAC